MKFHVYAKGTKVKLSQPWEIHTHPGLYKKGYVDHFTLAKGTILSLHDIDIRGNAKYPKSMTFQIPKKGCPTDVKMEGRKFVVTLLEAANADFEFATKADEKLNDLDAALISMTEEINSNTKKNV